MPYQALVIRESAMLFLGFAPWGRKAFSAREPSAAKVYSPDSLDCTTPTPEKKRGQARLILTFGNQTAVRNLQYNRIAPPKARSSAYPIPAPLI